LAAAFDVNMTRIQIEEKLQKIGLIVLLPGELPRETLVEIVDALLASPVEAVQIVPNGPNTIDTLQTFRQRAGDNMLVGADRVDTVEELHAVMQAGAQFASSLAEFHVPLLSYAKKNDFLYIPTVHSPGQTLLASRAGSVVQKLRDDIDVEGLEGLIERSEMANYAPCFAINQIATEFIDAAYDGGARIVCVNDIYSGEGQWIGDIITRARTARRIWLELGG
jgi:2-keto-3-deoxy-6-phosphogluconate aldolase